MSSQAVKRKLSGSTDGKPIKIVNTATGGSPEDVIHTSIAGTTAGTFDEIWLWAYNGHTADVELTIEFGGAGVPDQTIVQTIKAKAGLVPIIPGLILQNGMVVKAFAGTTNVITISGFVNAISDT